MLTEQEWQKIFAAYHLVPRPEGNCMPTGASTEDMFSLTQDAIDGEKWNRI